MRWYKEKKCTLNRAEYCSPYLRIRWYGEQYSAPELEHHYEETVYIRDSGKELMVYSMEADCWDEKAKIKATFSLICRIQKHSTGFRYGRKIQ